jgi:serine/threonine protein kinase
VCKILEANSCEAKQCEDIINEAFKSELCDVLKAIAFQKDKNGRILLHIMDNKVAAYVKEQIFFLKRYELVDVDVPIHCSATAVVFKALDHQIVSQETCNSQPSHVVIKFMLHEDQYKREISIRKKCELDDKYVIGILNSFDISSKDITTWPLKEIKLRNGKNLATDYMYGIVMEAADRNLDTIFQSERPTINHIKKILQEVGAALQHCHRKNMIHGDLKMLNIVRVGDTMRLIDFDAAASFGDAFGAKFSSGILPPEMLYKLQTKEEVDQYMQVVYLIINFCLFYTVICFVVLGLGKC